MTRLGDKVPVETLEAPRVARIEQQVLSELRATEFAPLRSRWSLARVAMPMLAVAAVLAVAWLGTRALRPEVQRVALPAAESVRPQRITTGDGGTRLELGDAVIAVAANTSFELRRSGGGILVMLEHGTVDCEVEPRGARPPFVVRAGEVAVTVVGTRFTVERDDEVKVHVVRGKVRVEAAGEVAMVAAGQGWTAGRGVQVAAAGRLANPGEAAAPKDVALDVDGDVTLRGRVATAPSTSRDRAKPRGAQDRKAPIAGKDPVRFAAGVAAKPTLAAIMPSSASEPRAAAAEYLQTALRQKTSSRDAAWALYSKAYVEYTRLRHAGAALDTLDIFDRRFNAGAYTEAALKLRITITCGTGRKDACRGAAHKYLGQFPDGDYREHARAITNWDVTR